MCEIIAVGSGLELVTAFLCSLTKREEGQSDCIDYGLFPYDVHVRNHIINKKINNQTKMKKIHSYHVLVILIVLNHNFIVVVEKRSKTHLQHHALSSCRSGLVQWVCWELCVDETLHLARHLAKVWGKRRKLRPENVQSRKKSCNAGIPILVLLEIPL